MLFQNSKEQLTSILFGFLLILLFVIPIIIFGIEDIEDYEIGIFSSTIIAKHYFNPFIFMIDYYGPGIEFPLGMGIFFHPLILLIKSKKIFFLFFFSFHLFLSCYYFLKILKYLNINLNITLAFPLIIFANMNFNTAYANDWITTFFCFNFSFLVFYQFLKILNKNNIKDYIKFTIFFYLWFLNGHYGYPLIFISIFIIIFLFSSGNKIILKSYKPYIFILILFLLLLEKFYYIGSELLDLVGTDKDGRSIQKYYSFKDLINSMWPFYSYYRVYDRLPPNPYLLIISLFFVFKYFKDNKFNNIKISYLASLIFLFSPIFYFATPIPGLWWFRDVAYILACIIFINYFNIQGKRTKILLLSLMIVYITSVFAANVRGISKTQNNYIIDKAENFQLINFFESLELDSEFNRIYLSPKSFKLVSRPGGNFYGIYNQTDLTKYNLIPFNGNFKIVSSTKFFEKTQIDFPYTAINPKIEHLKNPIFLSLFYIKYSLIEDSELKKLNTRNYNILKTIILDEGNFHLIENNISFLSIIKEDELKSKIVNCNKAMIDCILDNQNHFKKIEIEFKRIKNGHYVFFKKSKDLNQKFVLPFIYNVNWGCNDNKCENVGKFLTYGGDNYLKLELKYNDKFRSILIILSLLIFILLLITALNFKKITNLLYNK